MGGGGKAASPPDLVNTALGSEHGHARARQPNLQVLPGRRSVEVLAEMTF
jgi:hypothetical protein